MTMPYVQGPMHPLRDSREHSNVRRAIMEFLTASSSSSPQPRVCPSCGRTMQHVDVVLSLYGADTQWKLQLPVCVCSISSDLAEGVKGGSTTGTPSSPEEDPN